MDAPLRAEGLFVHAAVQVVSPVLATWAQVEPFQAQVSFRLAPFEPPKRTSWPPFAGS